MNKRADGCYQVTKTIQRMKFYGYGNSPEEARADLERKLLDAELTRLTPDSKLHDVAKEVWYPSIVNLEPLSKKRYEADYGHIAPILGNRPIGSITTADVQKFVNLLSKTQVSRSGAGKETHPMAPKTIEHVYGTLRRIMRLAEASGVIQRSPCTIMVKLPKLPPKRERYMPVTDAADLLASVPDEMKLTVFLAAVLGLRKSEVAGLQWSKIDRTAKSIRIDQQLTDEGTLKGLKHDSKRTLTVPKAFLDYIDKWGDLDSKSGFVCTRDGKPWVPNTIYEHWRRWADKNGYKDWTYHDLRHLAAGLIASATGGDVLAVQSVLGHASINMTAVYLAREAAQTSRAFEDLGVLTHGKSVSKKPI